MGGGQSNMLSMFVTVWKVISYGFVWYTARGRTLDQNWVEKNLYFIHRTIVHQHVFHLCYGKGDSQ